MKFCAFLPAFIPPVSYFMTALHSDRILFADHLQFSKHSPAHRIIFEDGGRLSVPLRHQGRPVALFQKRLTDDDHWKQQHLTFLKHRYHDFPYFDDLFYELEEIYAQAGDSLSGFLFSLMHFYRRRLKLDMPCLPASEITTGDINTFYTHFFSQNSFSEYIYNPRFLPLSADFQTLLREHQIRPAALTLSLAPDPPVIDFIFRHGPEAPFLLRRWSRNCTLSDN